MPKHADRDIPVPDGERTRRRSTTEGIATALRRRIATQRHRPGERLPTRAELRREFGASPVTVQRVFDRLAAEGFVTASGARGTFVANNPPFRSRYGVVLPWSGSWFWEALAREARALDAEDSDHTLLVYPEAWPRPTGETPNQRELVQEVTHHRFAGLIFGTAVHDLRGSPLLEEPGLGRVVIAGKPAGPGVPAVAPDRDAWIQRALERLAAKGVRRVAVIDMDAATDAILDRGAAETGLSIPRAWRLHLSPEKPLGVRRTTTLLMGGAGRAEAERPDGLLVLDDHLLEAVTLGVADAGVSVPEQLSVIGHANFPLPTRGASGFTRLGFDAHEILRTCIDVIDRQRRGEDVPALQSVPPRFQEETASAARPRPASIQAGA